MHDDSSHEAIPLMTQDEYVHDFHRGVSQVHAQPLKLEEDPELELVRTRWPRSTILLLLACFVTALSLFLNAATFVRSWHPRSNNAPEKLDVSKLRRPSLYLGLERTPELLQHQGPISQALHSNSPSSVGAGWPARVARVSSAYPDSVFAQDGWVVLTEQDHTIMEFAATPARAEQRCALQAYLPARRDLRDKLLTLERDDSLAPDPVIRFTALSPSPIDFSSLTWSSRPSAVRLVDLPVTLTAVFGQNQTTVPFPCPSGGPLRVEMLCLGGGCRVEYDASSKLVDIEPLLGIQLVGV